ncbi:MAG: tetratricopeptide repeat protein [Acidobacteriaceae bacterium]
MAIKKAAPIQQPANTAALEQAAALGHYEAALRMMHDRKYDRAKAAFEKLLESASAPRHIADRVRVHLNACSAKLDDGEGSKSPKSPEEQYDYSVVLMNEGRNDEARSQLEKVAKGWPEADYAHYGLAVLSCMAGRSEEALRHLRRSIDLNPRNRIQARNDGDFQNMADDPRFTELLYPESLGETASPHWRS